MTVTVQRQALKQLVEALNSLSDSELRVVMRFVNALKHESSDELDDFDRWAIRLAKRNKFDHLTDEDIAQIVQEYRRAA